MIVQCKKTHPLAFIPMIAKPGDVCFDLHACDRETGVVLWPGQTLVVYTGLAFAIPEGWEGIVRGRSGNAAKGLQVVTGTLDSGYRGEVGCILYNASRDQMCIRRGDRIAQLAIRQVPDVQFLEVDALDDTARGATGFGSTGV